jgi:hypothetical protein
MEVSVAMRAHRKLRKLSRYIPINENKGTSSWRLALARLHAGESAVGVYENSQDSIENCILVTNQGLHFYKDDKWLYLNYEDMMSADLDNRKASNIDHITIHLRTGESVLIPVLGGDTETGTRDAFAMLMFLDHVLGDLSRRSTR